jgi:pimeloyl-ACP methyl ester carboxylesterase
MTNKLDTWFAGSNCMKSALTIYYPKQVENSPLLIFAHGFKGFKDWGHFPKILESFAKAGFVVVAFNFSHNGGTVEEPIDFPNLESFSENTYLKELNDVGHILRWILTNEATYFKQADLGQIALLGHSRGGGIALLAANKYTEIKKVVTWASVADFFERLPGSDELEKWRTHGLRYIVNGRTKQNMPMKFGFVKSMFDHKEELSIKDAVSDLNIPALVVHGDKDETVKLESVERICSWNKNVDLVIVKNCNHTFNGKHPWKEKKSLPTAAIEAIQATLIFLKT